MCLRQVRAKMTHLQEKTLCMGRLAIFCIQHLPNHAEENQYRFLRHSKALTHTLVPTTRGQMLPLLEWFMHDAGPRTWGASGSRYPVRVTRNFQSPGPDWPSLVYIRAHSCMHSSAKPISSPCNLMGLVKEQKRVVISYNGELMTQEVVFEYLGYSPLYSKELKLKCAVEAILLCRF